MPSQLLTSDNADFASSTAGSGTMSYLITRTLFPSIIDAVRRKLMLRGLAARVFGPSSIPGRTLVIPMQKEYASSSTALPLQRITEGGEIPLGQTQFENLTLTPVKYGVRIGVSKELQEDAITDLLSYHAELAGFEFAMNEESLIISQLDSGTTASSQTVANSNATLPISDITESMQQLETDNYRPTHMIVGVEVANDLRNIEEFNTAKDTGGANYTNQSMVGSILGMKVLMSNSVSAKLAYVIDANHAFVIAEKRPITMEKYSDYARDTGFVVITQRIAVSYLRSSAMSEITTT